MHAVATLLHPFDDDGLKLLGIRGHDFPLAFHPDRQHA
jgi:hypothetical protein